MDAAVQRGDPDLDVRALVHGPEVVELLGHHGRPAGLAHEHGGVEEGAQVQRLALAEDGALPGESEGDALGDLGLGREIERRALDGGRVAGGLSIGEGARMFRDRRGTGGLTPPDRRVKSAVARRPTVGPRCRAVS